MDIQTTTPTTSATPPPPAAVSTPTTGATTTTTGTAPTPAERPKTMAEAFARDAAAHPSETSAPPDGATTLPVEATDQTSATHPSTDAKTGPIPFEVHKTALDNARTKAVDEFRQTAGIDKAVEFAQKINTNAPGFWREMTSELLAHPVHGAALRSDLARMFGGLRQTAQAQQAAAEPMPAADVQIVDANGNVTGTTYSAEQLEKRDAWRERRQESARQKSEADRRTAAAQAEATTKAVATRTDEMLAEVADTLEFDEDTTKDQRYALFAKVNELMAQNPKMSAHRAALEVRRTHILPTRAGKAQADVLETLKTKAAAQAVNPAGAVVATTSRPKSFLDPSLKW